MEGPFKDLLVWQKAMELVRKVYQLIKAFPADERYALTDQLRRAVVSIPSNIAEGNGRAGNKDYAHFLSIARGSLYETLTQIQIACDLGYIKKDDTFRCTPTPTTYTSPTPTPTTYTSPTPTPTTYTSSPTFTLNDIDVLSAEIGRMLTTMLKKFGNLRPTPPTYTSSPTPTPTPSTYTFSNS